jgi:DNA polymerase (family 10)
MKNREIAKMFSDIANMLEIKGDNPFRIRAYRRAAQNIESYARDISGLQPEELRSIPGIGHDLTEKIREYAETGQLTFYNDLKQDVPSGLLSMLSIPGVGPRTVKMFYDLHKIRSIEDLERLAKKGKLRDLPGIQEKTEENILRGIAMIRRRTDRLPIGRVLPLAEDIMDTLRRTAPVRRLVLAGSLRRWKETVKDIDILATSGEPKRVMQVFSHLPQVKDILMTGPTKSSVVTHEGIQVDVRVVEENSFGSALAYFTGSKSHNIRLREMALKKGLKINEYGIFDLRTGKKIGGKLETAVYNRLGLSFIPPELREDQGEIEAAANRNLPSLIELNDIKGDLHVHSKDSDGSHDVRELIVAAKDRGYDYLAITDHSRGLGIAHGMSIEKLIDQNKKIHAMNKRLRGFRLLSGIEMDIRSDGTMDYPDDVLKKLDIVIASVHSGFRQSRQQITKRLVSAMNNPFVSIIAHPSGRLLGEREPYEVDMEEVLRIAGETGTAIEINAYPLRLDLNDTYARRAQQRGVHLVISTDAHMLHQFDSMRYGIGTARRAWLGKEQVVNTLPCRALLKRLGARSFSSREEHIHAS